ncbi:hypothetical protein [Haliangium sp.]|uniref:hypothetical protein n=1 Tax=Haliangium sp. TaxID=2663208 RepID=UPI003D1034D2
MRHTPLPLPQIWSVDLPWFFMAIFPPIARGDRVVARCGAKLVCVRADDGHIEWTAEVDPDRGMGAYFLTHEGDWLTDRARLPPRCLGTLLCLDERGAERWQRDLDTMIALAGASVRGDRLGVLSLDETGQAPTMLYRVALADGALDSTVTLTWPADALMPTDEGWLVRSHRTGAGTPGLYRMDPDGVVVAEPVIAEPVIELARAGAVTAEATLMAVVRVDDAHELRVLDARSLAPKWSCPLGSAAAALDADTGDTVFHIDGEDGGSAVVARDAGTGATRWRSPAIQVPPKHVSSIAACGPVLICNHRQGQVLLASSDGRVIGEAVGSYGPALRTGDRLYLSRPGALVCISVAELAG